MTTPATTAQKTTARRAARAAAAAAARLGVRCAEPVVLADGANVIVHLPPAPVVAKVAASTPAVRPNPGAWLQRELDLAAFLAAGGLPVIAPADGLPAVVCRRDDQVMSFWAYTPRSADQRPDEGTIGSMLRDLHTALRGYPGSSWPVLAPLGDIPAFLARPRTLLTAADTAVLAGAYRRLSGELGAAWRPGQVLHGDAGAANLMHAGGRWVWHDFEDTCAGPVAWDLAATTASPRLDAARILAAYGDETDEAQLRACEGLRRLHLTVWYALYAERLPGCRPRAAELLASWRVPSS
jgi:Ser/Thr protein kinase RdoA (MazF antagonist)